MTAPRTRPCVGDPKGRHHRNGHLLELDGPTWVCLHCRHRFDAAVDADRFWCGDDCTGKHPGDGPTQQWKPPTDPGSDPAIKGPGPLA